MKASSFIHEMYTTSAILSRKAGIRVQFSGDGAWTNGKVINLPQLDYLGELEDVEVKRMRGYVDHEAAHNLFTDMAWLHPKYKKALENGRESLEKVGQFMEDVWIEKHNVEHYPGSHKNLEQLNADTVQDSLDQFQQMKQFRPDLFKTINKYSGTTLLKLLASNYKKSRDFNGMQEVIDMYDPEVVDYMQKVVDHVEASPDSRHNWQLAKALYKLFEDDPENGKAPEELPEFSPELGDELDENTKGSEPDRPAEEKKGKGAKGKASKGSGEKEKGDGSPSNEKDFSPEYLPDPVPAGGVDAEDFKAHDGGGAIGGLGNKRLTTETYYKACPDQDVVHTSKGSFFLNGNPCSSNLLVNKASKNYEKYNEEVAEVSSSVNVMKNKLRRLLIAREQREWDPGRTEGKLDNKRLVAAYNRKPEVFKAKVDRFELNTACTVLVDMSGSMCGRKAIVAQNCMVALAECLKGTAIQFKLSGFCNKRWHSSPPDDSHYHNLVPFDHFVFKDFNDSLRSQKGAIASLTDLVGGDNSDFDALDYEMQQLNKRPETRKVLFVLSDGHPAHASHADWTTIAGCMKNLIKKNSAVETVGIGICDSAVKKIYKDCVVVNDVKELSGTVFNKLGGILLK